MSDTRNNIYTSIKHSTLSKNEMDYHFANPKDARLFIRYLQTSFWSKKVASQLIDRSHRCKYSDNYQRCSTVTMTHDQFDAIHGAKSFHEFHSIYRLIEDEKKSIPSLTFTKIPPGVIKELSFLVPTLTDKACNVLAMTTINDIELINYSFFRDQLLPRLFMSTIEKMHHKNNSYDFLFQMLLKSKLSHHELNLFLKKVGRKTCREFIYSLKIQIFDLNTELQNVLFVYFSNKEFNQFVSNVITNENDDDQRIVAILSHHQRLKPSLIAKLNYQRKRNQYFVDNPKKISRFVNVMFDYSDEIKPLTEKNSLLQMIDFSERGQSNDHWIWFAEDVMQYVPKVVNEKISLTMPFRFNEEKIMEMPTKNINDFTKEDWKFEKFIRHENEGIILQLKNSMDDSLLFRIQQKDESIDLLLQEYKTMQYFKREGNKLGLHSYFPEPMGMITLIGLNEWITTQFSTRSVAEEIYELIGKRGKYGGFVYHVPSAHSTYFQFLDDPSLIHSEYKKANQIIIHDLMIMLNHGMLFPFLANLVHHSHSIKEERYDFGRFWVLSGLLLGTSNGTGRLERFESLSNGNNNLRASGIINWQRFITFNDLIGVSSYNRKYFRGVYASQEKVANFVIVNLLAEYQYILFILAGLRGLSLEKIKNIDKETLWQDLANQVLSNSAYASSLMTHCSPFIVENIFSDLVNVKRIARQMQYWMTHEYIADVMNDQIKDEIYAPDTKVHVNHGSFIGSFNSFNGFSFDFLHSDLGNLHGQEPIKEANKLFYLMITYILATYVKFKLTLDDLHKIITCKDLQKSENIRKHSFQHLYGKNYHAVQEKLCEERLSHNQTPLNVKNSLIAEMKNHQKEKAAFTIAHFWRRHKKPSSAIPEIKKLNTLIL